MIATGQFTIYDLNDVIIAGAAPTSPAVNTLWLDTSVVPNQLKKWSGNAWMVVNDTAELDERLGTVEDSAETLDTRVTSAESAIEAASDNQGTMTRGALIGNIGSWARNEAKTVSVPASGITRDDLAKLCIYPGSPGVSEYAGFLSVGADPPVLTVTYQ